MSRLEPQEEIFKKLQAAERERAEKRAHVGKASFLAGDDSLLLQKDVLNAFAGILSGGEESKELITRLSHCLANDDVNVRRSAISLLALVFIHQPSQCFGENPLSALKEWFEREDEFFSELGVLLRSVGHILHLSISAGNYSQVEPLLEVLHKISYGKIFKDHRIKHEVSRALENFVIVEILQSLWQDYRSVDTQEREVLQKIFFYLGAKSGTFLLHQLIDAEEKVDRLLIVELLGQFDASFHSILFDCLFARPPWFVTRNILALVVELEADISDKSFEILMAYKDVRVQEELVRTLIHRGGKLLHSRLLILLPELDPRVQILAVNGLIQSEDKDVLSKLLEFVEGHFRNLIQHEQVMVSLCSVLEKAPTIHGENVLRHIHEEAVANPQYARLNHFVAKALAKVHPRLRHEECAHNVPDDIRSESDPQLFVEAQGEMEKIFSEIEKSAQGESAATKAKALCVLGLKKFEENKRALARALLDMALEIDPNGQVNFQKLADKLAESVDFYGVLFEELEQVLAFLSPVQIDKIKRHIEIEEYRTGETLVKKGEIDPALYFVLEGEVYLSCVDNGKKVFLKKMGEGESLGHSLFFNSSLWGENAVATMPTIVGVLSFDRLEKCKLNDSTLTSRLVEFCRAQHFIPRLIAGAGAERRRDARFYPVDLTAKISLIEQMENRASYPIAAKIENISKRGAAISVCLSGQKNVHTFLGTEMSISLRLEEGSFFTPAYIVAVRWISQDKYTLHVHFQQSLEKEILMTL